MRVSTVVSLSMGLVALVATILVERVISQELDKQASSRAGLVAEKLLSTALNAASKISAERGSANGVLGSDLPLPRARIKSLTEARNTTDEALRVAETALSEHANFPHRMIVADSLSTVRKQFLIARNQVDALGKLPRAERKDAEIKAAITAMIETLPLLEPGLNAIETTLVRADPAMTNYVAIARLATDMRDIAGQLGSVFTPAFVLKRPLSAGEIGHAERLLGVVQAIDHQLRLAHQRTGSSEELASALAVLDRDFTNGGLPLVRHLLETSRAGNVERMTAAEFAKVYVPQMNVILDLRSVVLSAIEQRMIETEARSRKSLLINLMLIVSVILSVVLTFLLIRGRITYPLSHISRAIRKLAQGDDRIDLPAGHREDEIGEVVQALGTLTEVVRARETESRVAALVTEILEKIQPAESVEDLFRCFFASLADPMHIGIATFYRYDEDAAVLVSMGGYAQQDGMGHLEHIKLGETLVGLCARQRKPQLIVSPENDYLRIRVGLGYDCAPCSVLLLPIMSDNELIGVVEMATLKPIEADVREAIDRILPTLALRILIIGRVAATKMQQRQTDNLPTP